LRIWCFPRHFLYFSRFDSDGDRVLSDDDSACDRNYESTGHNDSTGDNDSSGHRNRSRESSRFNRLHHNTSYYNIAFNRNHNSSDHHSSSDNYPSDYRRRDNTGGYASSRNAVRNRV
jgi:hypothetical protein